MRENRVRECTFAHRLKTVLLILGVNVLDTRKSKFRDAVAEDRPHGQGRQYTSVPRIKWR